MVGAAVFIGYCLLAVLALGVTLSVVAVLVESEKARAFLHAMFSMALVVALGWLDLTYNNGALIGWVVIAAVMATPWLVYRVWKIRRHGSDHQVRQARKKLGYDS